MKILSIQGYNPKSKVNSKNKSITNQNVSFTGLPSTLSSASDILHLHFELMKATLESRFINRKDISRTLPLTKPEEDILEKIYQEISSQGIPNKNGTFIKEINPQGLISGKIESGPVYEIESAARLAGKIRGNINDCTLYTISDRSVEGFNNIYSVLFDEHGAPKILVKLDEKNNLLKTFIVKILGQSS